ncbi:MAG: hypothetical protein II135_00460 [Clostridia bacterium]|nr:hypothetical protein [Clostridia bacterium]
MSDKTMKNECRGLIRRIKSSGFLPVKENLYYILPRLREATAALSKRAGTGFLAKLAKWLGLCSYSVQYDGLCVFLRSENAADTEVRRIRAYLAVCFCRRLSEENDVLGLWREAEKLDYRKLINECSPLEARLSFYPDYAQSDDDSRAEYRSALYKKAKKENASPVGLLSKIPAHRLTAYLFNNNNKYYTIYIILLIVITALPVGALLLITKNFPVAFFSALPLYQLAAFLSGRIFSRFIPAKKPLRLNGEVKLPPYLIVITALLEEDSSEHIKALTDMYFTESGKNEVYFGILGDLPDSKSYTDKNDEKLIKGYAEKIDGLNRSCGGGFFLFYRQRKYSVGEESYTAPERKRGAVCELIKQIREGVSELEIVGDASLLYKIPYIITLDSDTLMFPGSSDGMIRAAYHPYNRAVVDMKKRRVVSGHAILQPRIKVKLPDDKSTYFSRVFFPDPGIDCYRGADFDVFNAVFSRGVFCGKGVIDTAAFYVCACGVLPRGKILSHDAVEGCLCRCGALTDVVMYEGAPKNALSYFRRQNRWIRGDVQSLILCGKSYVGHDGKSRLPGMRGFDRYVLIGNVLRDITPVFAVSAIITSLFCSFLPLGSLFALSYIYLTEIPFILSYRLPRRERAYRICRLFLCLSLLFYDSSVSQFAVLTALFRMLTGKNLLKWTASSFSEKKRDGAYSYFFAFFPSLIYGAALSAFSYGAAIVSGSCAAFSMIAAYLTSKSPEKPRRIRPDKAFLVECVRDHFRYFTDLVTPGHGYLPPDNFQKFGGVGAAPRTSPTNIGLYLVSVIAAADVGVISKESVCDILAPTVDTLCKLPKRGGLLYNWYDTRTLSAIGPYVSTVDCGNYLCCLIALRAALSEYEKYDAGCEELRKTVDGLIKECDLSVLYDEKSGLFRIGDGDGSDNCYDLYISEMHTTDIAAVAYGFAPVSHMSRLGRPVAASGDVRGLCSWSGTAFEYFMPSLFLPSPDGSISGCSLDFALHEQKKHGAATGAGRIFGISESCYFAFDRKMNYQYKAHGVQSAALCEHGGELVLSPYSDFLMLCRSKAAERSLLNMKALGMYGEYGFYEAIDLTKSRVGGGHAVIGCFMAHHIGMSIVAAANAICGDIFVKRFCSDKRISAYLPLLYEKMPDTPPIERRRAETGVKKPQRVCAEEFKADAAAVTNTVCTVTADGHGTGLYRKDVCICDHNAGLLRRLSLLCRGYSVFDLFSYPCSFSETGIEYRKDGAAAVLSVSPDQEAFTVDVSCSQDGCALCFEPILSNPDEYRRHAAYSAVFVTSSYENGVLTVTNRSGGRNYSVSVAAVSSDRVLPLTFLCRADSFYGKSVEKLFFTERSDATGACVFPRLLIKTDRGSVKFYIAFGVSADASKAQLYAAVGKSGVLPRPYPRSLPPVETQLFCSVLKCFLHPEPKTAPIRLDRSYRGLLYRAGISGQKPILLIDCRGEYGMSRMKTVFPRYAQVAVRALVCGIGFDTVIIYDGDDSYYCKKKKELDRLIGSLGLSALVGERIFALEADRETAEALYGLCFYFVCASDMKTSRPAPPPAGALYAAKSFYSDKPVSVINGAVIIPSGRSFAPQSFVYANSVFGALVTDRSGGFSFGENCRMMKLTRHDTVPGGASEQIILCKDGASHELFSSAYECRFHLSSAEWVGRINGEEYEVKIAVDPVLPYKTVKIRYPAECSVKYIAKPVIGENFVNGSLRFHESRNTVFVSNALEPGRPEFFINVTANSKASFDGETLTVNAEFAHECTFSVGAVKSKACLDHMLHAKSGVEARYAAKVKRVLSPFSLHSPDRTLDLMFNEYAPYQSLFCRTYARCGYYQQSGAYGFRDQLQDCLCTVYGSPSDVKAHILRCAAHQYEEGDVMHWFHSSDGTGVRTRCSDDMLWLIVAVGKYIAVTGDAKILDIKVRYLSSALLSDDERDRYEAACPSETLGTVLEHCKKAAGRIAAGSHGLCLIGGGDWNDGMNEAGIKGRGESVWLSFFAASALVTLASLCRLKEDASYLRYEKLAASLLAAAEKHGFDGDHYIRGYLDNGEPFGRSGDPVCEIDILPQAAAAFLSEDGERVKRSLDSAYEMLFDHENGIFRLFYPPFDLEPGIGYIASYPPGIRENGGQYTHGAIWGAMGYLHAGQTGRGFEILRAVNPLNRIGDTRYGVENYVFSADIYTAEGVYGRGGWSWYTGSASWYFCAVLEHLLGYREYGGGFEIKPRFCSDLPRFTLIIRRHGTEYTVKAENVKKQTSLDGLPTDLSYFPFDHGCHTLDLGIN